MDALGDLAVPVWNQQGFADVPMFLRGESIGRNLLIFGKAPLLHPVANICSSYSLP